METVVLYGAEQVQNAVNRFGHSVDQFSQSVNYLAKALQTHQYAMERLADELQAERAKEVIKLAREGE